MQSITYREKREMCIIGTNGKLFQVSLFTGPWGFYDKNWDSPSSKPIIQKVHDEPIYGVHLDADERRCYCCCGDGSILKVDLDAESDFVVQTLKLDHKIQTSHMLANKSRIFCAESAGNKMSVVSIEDEEMKVELTQQVAANKEDWIRCIDGTSDDSLVIMGTLFGNLVVYSVEEMAVVSTWNAVHQGQPPNFEKVHEDIMTSLAVLIDEKRAVCGFENGSIRKIDILTGEILFTKANAHDAPIRCLLAAADEFSFYSSCGWQLKRWKISDCTLLAETESISMKEMIEI